MFAEPLELMTLPGQEEVIHMNNGPEASFGMSEDTAGDLALLKLHFFHVTLDYGKPSEWGITGAV